MSNIIPPLLSNSPPPIVGPIDDDDDDDFSDFRAAVDLSYDIEGTESSATSASPDGSPKKPPEGAKLNDSLDINSNNEKNEQKIEEKSKVNGEIDVELIENDCQLKFELPTVSSCLPNGNSGKDDCLSKEYVGDQKEEIDERSEFGNFSRTVGDVTDIIISESLPKEILKTDCDLNNSTDFSYINDNLFDSIFQNHDVDNGSPEEQTKGIPGNHLEFPEEILERLKNVSVGSDSESFVTLVKTENSANSPTLDSPQSQDVYSANNHSSPEVIRDLPPENTLTYTENNEEFSASSYYKENEDDFGQFAFADSVPELEINDDDFRTCSIQDPQQDLVKEDLSCTGCTETEQTDDFGDFSTAETKTPPPITELDDDDFGDFASSDLPQPEPTVTVEDDFDDFAHFPDMETENQTETLVLNKEEAFKNTETIVKEIFVQEKGGTNDDYQYVDMINQDSIFNELKDVTETNALSYQWSKSTSQEMFLKSLNIDTRNILYGPAWNPSMPRFAANLGLTPLEPVKSEILTPTPTKETISPTAASQPVPLENRSSDIPSVEFDWTGSGLVNPLEETSPKDTQEPKPSFNFESSSQEFNSDFKSTLQINTPTKPLEPSNFSVETELKPKPCSEFSSSQLDILNNFASLSITKSTFDDCSSRLSNPLPLRETHISHGSSYDVKDRVPAPILLPETKPSDDDFDDFQMGLPVTSKQVHEPVVVPKQTFPIKSNSISEVTSEVKLEEPDDEFTDFCSSAPPPVVPQVLTSVLEPSKPVVEPIKPVVPILEPLKPAVIHTYTPVANQTINWPDPGITDEDIKHFELSYSRPQKEVIESKNDSKKPVKNKVESVDDDEWSDFVSVQQQPSPLHKLSRNDRTASPDLPLSVLNLSHIQSPKKPIPVITPHGLMQTKLSSKMSAPKTVNAPTSSASQSRGVQNHQKSLDDDDWSDFVSSPAVSSNGFVSNLSGGWKCPAPSQNMISTIQKVNVGKKSQITVQSLKSTVSSISAMPDLDFIAPNKVRTSNRK